MTEPPGGAGKSGTWEALTGSGELRGGDCTRGWRAIRLRHCHGPQHTVAISRDNGAPRSTGEPDARLLVEAASIFRRYPCCASPPSLSALFFPPPTRHR